MIKWVQKFKDGLKILPWSAKVVTGAGTNIEKIDDYNFTYMWIILFPNINSN